jgi:hypothetical protein
MAIILGEENPGKIELVMFFNFIMQFIILEKLMRIGRSTETTNINKHLIRKLTGFKYTQYK